MGEPVKPRSASYDFLWLSLVLFVVLVVSFLLPLQPQDYWWYLRIGKDTLSSGALPRVDTLTFTRAGARVFYQSWLSAVILWLTFKAGGLTLTFLLRGVLMTLAYGGLWGMMRKAGAETKLASLLTVVLALSSSNNWMVRPQMFAYPLFMLSLWIMWRWQHGSRNAVWFLPPITLLWVNLHGSFTLVFILALSGLVFGKGDRKRLGLALVLCLAVSLINPYGAGGWSYVLAMLSNPSNRLFSNEWRPPVNAGWQMNLFYLWLLAFAPLAAFSPRRLSLLEWIWFIAFGWLALSGLRYVIWFVFVMGLLTALLLSHLSPLIVSAESTPHNKAINIILGGIFIFATLAALPGLREKWWPQAPSPYGVSTPVAATEWLASHPGLRGELFSNFGFSSYLEYTLPARRVWIDTRFELYPVAQWQTYIQIATASKGWSDVLKADHINLLMLSTDGESALITALRDSGAWCQPFADDTSTIFVRRTADGSCP